MRWLALLFFMFSSGCVVVPPDSAWTATSDTASVSDTLLSDGVSNGPRKYDFLWVIDHSSSMCKQQLALSAGFADFLEALKKNGEADVQMAVVTVQQIPDTSTASGSVTVKKVGEFNHRAASAFPPNCIEHYRAPCFVDPPNDATTPSEQCRAGFNFQFTAGKNYQMPATSLLNMDGDDPAVDSAGKPQHAGPPYGDVLRHYAPYLAVPDDSKANEWRCVQPTALSQVTNDNGSINSYCQRHCSFDTECQKLLGNQSAICYTPGGTAGDPKTSGCMLPPNTKDCPDVLPSVVKNDQLDLFHCIATVGASSSVQSGFEGGLRSAWIALDPAGANCPGGPSIDDGNGKSIKNPDCQFAQLVRDDAYLVIVVVSDDDDCSVDLKISLAYESPDEKIAVKAILPTEDWNSCQSKGDAVGGNRRVNEGNCLYTKSKQPIPADYKCPADCVVGAADYDACVAAAELNVQKNRAVDPRFAPVSDFVNRFRGLKSDQAKVIFAAITGDSPAQAFQGGKPQFDKAGSAVADDAQKVTDASAFYKALRHNISARQAPYVCAGRNGESGYGSRYIEMASGFGQNGMVANICNDDLSATLNDLATFLATR